MLRFRSRVQDLGWGLKAWGHFSVIHMYTSIYIYMYIHIQMYIFNFVYKYVCVYIYITYMNIC